MARYSRTRYSLLILLAACAPAADYTVVDVEAVRATGDPASFVRTFTVPAQPARITCDVLVAGAGMGGVSAAMALASRGHSVCLTEETKWIGGQMTAGGVSALDEHKFIELGGAPRAYLAMRERIRDVYRAKGMIRREYNWSNLNPGACYVSSLCFEPKTGVEVLEKMLAAHSGIRLMKRTIVAGLEVNDGAVVAAVAYNLDTKRVTRIVPRFVLDATEMGDLLPMAGVPYAVGSEARSATGEPHAADTANSACVQSFTYPFVIEHRPGVSHRIAEPPEYAKIRDHQPFSFTVNYPQEFGWRGAFTYKMFGEDAPVPNNMSPGPFFAWRRILANKVFSNVPHDLALINWPKQDYHDESLLDRTPLDAARILQEAKRVALAFLFWLQTDVARDEGGGKGYPELMLRKDVMGSEDGLSQYPYIRESRRIRVKRPVVEQDIVAESQSGPRAAWFADSVGTGFYMVDIHPCGANERGRMMMPRPFQIPLRAMFPEDVRNFLPAGKNLGVTHLTNGAFRLHPIEWNVGEAAAVVASLKLRGGYSVGEVQRLLTERGVPLVWFDDLPPSHPAFAAIQQAAISGFYPLDATGLHASPDAPMTRREAALALVQYFGKSAADPMRYVVEQGWMAVDHRNWFHEDLPLYWTDIRATLPKMALRKSGPVSRREWAERLTAHPQ